MKFMKLGSKPDQFQSTDGENIRYVATELATDIVITVGDVKFYLHKFPLLSKSSHLQKLVSSTTLSNNEINIHDIPGGPAAFEICAKFCYGITTTLNAYNVVPTRCAAEYLEMYETVEKGNLVYKIDVFISSSILKSWKDSIIMLQTTKSFLPLDSKIVSYCLDSVANQASTDPSRVDWSYTYDKKKLDSLRKQLEVPNDWWVEDLCELHVDLYRKVIMTIRAKGKIPEHVIAESLKAYTLKRVPFFNIGNDLAKYSYLVDTIISLLPKEKENSVSCGFLLRLLQASIIFKCNETRRTQLMKRISGSLNEASVGDLMIRGPDGGVILCDIDVVRGLVEGFCEMDGCDEFDSGDASKGQVARLVDGYLAEAARDSSLSVSKFVDLSGLVSGFPRLNHDGIYRSIDMYLKEHPSLTKSEKKRVCGLMDCKKLSAEACAHAVQNERLPLRAVVQVLFFEQARTTGGGGPVKSLLPRESYGSSVTTTTTNTSEEDWEELKGLKGELASLRLGNKGGGDSTEKLNTDKVTSKKLKKVLSRLWSGKDRRGEMSGSDTSDSPVSNGERGRAQK